MDFDLNSSTVLQNSTRIPSHAWNQRAPFFYNVKVVPMRFGIDVVGADRQLVDIGRLPQNWDGYDAASVDPVIVRTAREWLGIASKAASILPEISPNTNGTISFEWETASGCAHLEIGIKDFSFYLAPAAGLSYHIQGDLQSCRMAEIAQLVNNHLYPSSSYTQPTNSIVQRGIGVALF